MIEGTVGFYEKTVVFKKATDWLKNEKGVKFNELGKMLGLNKGQMNMVRIQRRYITNKEVDTLLQLFPEASKFFLSSAATNTTRIEGKETEQTLNEPMGTHFYGKKANPEPWEELVETQRKVIAMLERELAMVKERLMVVEAEKKTLVDIVSQRK